MNYPQITLPEMLRNTVSKRRQHPVILFQNATITYQAFGDQVKRVAAGLQALGIQKGDRVGLMMQNCPQFVVAYFGALQAGAIVTSTSPIYTSREAAHQWQDAGAKLVIADRALKATVEAALAVCSSAQRVVWVDPEDYAGRSYAKVVRAIARAAKRSRPAIPAWSGSGIVSHEWLELMEQGNRPKPSGLQPEDIACLQYTGGTTGTSKGAMLTHRNLVTNTYQAGGWLCGGRVIPETLVAALPLFHIYATTCVMIYTIRCGGRMVILPRFELQSALDVVKKYRPTIFHGVPTMYVAFNNAPDVKRYGFDCLRICMSGGAPLPVQVREKFEQLTGGRLVEGYGLTETSPVTHISPTDGTARSGSMGVLISDTQAKIVDVETGLKKLPVGEAGELCIRGPQVMKGYWNKPKETANVLRKGWLHTGDIAKRDADGFFYIVDRKKDLIIAGGYNVYPREVEEVLFEHPAIQEAVAIGVPDPYRGETVKACVVLKPDARASADEIASFCRERLASYKVPRLIEFRASLPKSGVGKYLRRELRDEHSKTTV
ncbi:MAG: long-chain fatty acid--CoA ligase [Verrucomicrobiales bacterium]|nr:long-chain fatty acid--CoA ligase [Verrucomicrobiales bacterium]